MKFRLIAVLITAVACLPAFGANELKKGAFEFTTFAVPGTPTGIGLLGVERINDWFTTVGYIDSTAYYGFFRTANGKITDLREPLSTGAGEYTLANSINNAGTVAGSFFDTAAGQYSSFFYRNGKFEVYNIPGLPQYSATIVNGINDLDAFCGYYEAAPAYTPVPFININGKITTTFNIPGATFIEPESISDLGVVAGNWADSAGDYHGFIREPKGKITIVDVPGAASPGTVILGVNILGWTSGHFFDAEDHEHGFLRSPQGVFYQVDAPGADLDLTGGGTAGGGLNDQGAIAGHYDPKDGGPEREYVAVPKFPTW